MNTKKIWLVGVSFVLFQFFLQLSSGVVLGAIMQELSFSAFKIGLLSSAFYYVYTGLQIPVGLLFDKSNARILLTFSVLFCSLGCLIFAKSYHFSSLIIGRLIIGAGSAFAFVGLSHLIRLYFPLKQFAFLMGLSETLGFLMTALGIISLGGLIQFWGWRFFIGMTCILGILIAICIWNYIPDTNNKDLVKNPVFNNLKSILASRINWLNGIFVGLTFSVITVFAAMWAVPFIQIKLSCSLMDASILDAMIFLGAAISCPLFGYLHKELLYRRPLMFLSCISTLILLIIVLYAHISNNILLGFLLFLIGLCCGSYMLSFAIANEIAPKNAASTNTGFTNTLGMLSAPILQPIIGYFLDLNALYKGMYSLDDYQRALLIIPFCLLLAGVLVFFLPEKGYSN
jgi:MFS family permease